ncbi:MAG: hypothetical protein ABR985_00855 [Methanotrichaceae archaeon]|jgi:hypothetical protein
MRSYILAGLTLLSILLIFSFSGVAVTDKGGMAKNMTVPMNTTVPVDMNMPMKKNMPINMNMPNRTGNGSMSMSDVTFQDITLNIVLIQNLTEITNTITPASINATNESKTDALNAVKSSAKAM